MNNDFIDIMHERLSQHQMPEPVGLWHDIAIALDANQKKKDFNLARWGKVAAVAAAIIAVAVMFQVLRNQEPQATSNGNEVAKTETPRTDVKMPSTSPEEDTDDNNVMSIIVMLAKLLLPLQSTLQLSPQLKKII